MALLGPADMKQFALPSGIDAGELTKLRLAAEQSTTYADVLNLLVEGVNQNNQVIMSDPVFGTLWSPTTEAAVEYGQGVTNGMEERTEYRRADARRGSTSGHMLPLKSYDRGLGWTEDFLRKARMIQIEQDIADALADVRTNFPRRLLTRFFSTAYNTVGTSGKDAPLVDGTTSDIDFAPPPYEGQAFANSHTHFDRKGTSEQPNALAAGAKHMWEHGILQPYNALVPLADIATYTALAKYIKPNRGVEYVATANAGQPYGQMSLALQDERAIGLYETDYGLVNLYMTPFLPTNYLGMWKPYGNGDQRSPLRVRYSPDYGMGAIPKADPDSNQPLRFIYLLHEFGVGTGNRLNGYACYFAASGNYTVPTIN